MNPIEMSHMLPIILVSACDRANAWKFIEELTKDEAVNGENREGGSRVWQIKNKYYHAQVQLIPLADGEQPPESWEPQVEAHIIYITETEEAAAAEARGAGGRAGVRLAVCAGAGHDELRAWARRRRYELVPLREEPDPDSEDDPDGPFAETYGLERARAALHAHAWRGLRRVDGAAAGGRARPSEPEEEDEEEDWEPEEAVERAERFAAALGALGAAGGGAAGAGALARLPPPERRAAAERLVEAFCRALGADLPAL